VITNTISAAQEVASHTVRRRGGCRRKRAINWARRRGMARGVLPDGLALARYLHG
jgi:hypothetical protein